MKCKDCSWYRPRGGGLGTCFVLSTPFGEDSTPVCGSFIPQIPEERDTKTLAGKFAEALGCIEDGLCWLGRVNEQYDADYPNDYDPPPRNRAMDFWLQAELAEDALKVVLHKLQRVEHLAPKEIMV